MKLRDKILSTIIGTLIAECLAIAAYIGFSHHTTAEFTEFYVLGAGGQAKDYPREMAVEEEATVKVGVVSHVSQVKSYAVVVVIDGRNDQIIGPFTVEPGGKSEHTIMFTPTQPGIDQKVEFMLYRDENTQAYLESLYFLVDVK
jgi:uncharacterized membrane protein